MFLPAVVALTPALPEVPKVPPLTFMVIELSLASPILLENVKFVLVVVTGPPFKLSVPDPEVVKVNVPVPAATAHTVMAPLLDVVKVALAGTEIVGEIIVNGVAAVPAPLLIVRLIPLANVSVPVDMNSVSPGDAFV